MLDVINRQSSSAAATGSSIPQGVWKTFFAAASNRWRVCSVGIERDPAVRGRALSGKRPAGSEGFGVGCGYSSDLLSPASFSAGCHPARRVAVPSFHPKLSRCRGAACRAWARHLLRERSQLGAQIRTGDRSGSAAVPSSTERSLASRRNGRPDREQAHVSVACRRPRGRGPRDPGPASSRPVCGPIEHGLAFLSIAV